jgi:hypothetical protein
MDANQVGTDVIDATTMDEEEANALRFTHYRLDADGAIIEWDMQTNPLRRANAVAQHDGLNDPGAERRRALAAAAIEATDALL